ncbi:MAG TPA: SRPBCC family protein [Polyangiales bacterium]|nr:SRPBCC family protein [Polyangiales bacterium]
MSENTGTVTFHRVLCAPPERVYRAFTDADAMAKWLPPHGFAGRVFELDARVGGRYRMQFTNLTTGHSHSFGGEFRELVPGERIVHTDRFDDPNLAGQMTTTIVLKRVSAGTALHVKQEGIPAVIPTDQCTVGWQQSLDLLRQLVEPEIPA